MFWFQHYQYVDILIIMEYNTDRDINTVIWKGGDSHGFMRKLRILQQ